MNVELKSVENSDKKLLAKFFCETLESVPDSGWQKYLLKISFVRRIILQLVSKATLKYWDKLKFWLILVDRKVVGFVMINWREPVERNERKATIQEIYLQPEFRGKKIEERVVEFVLDFCDDMKLRIGFPAKAEWNLWEK